MTVQFATIPVVHHYVDLPHLVRQIETWGFAAVGVPDAHWLWPDCYVTLTQCTLNSRRLRLGTFVTNPSALRDPIEKLQTAYRPHEHELR
ncbi:MAG: hypothetical protein AUH43_11740 [Acidobacteria bacterium 13_1_40CM_65_14]|nr:MAG: hypothetical protein AUH43_11740 [Acidobacteria bacterium 13_1_40CM_65_14]